MRGASPAIRTTTGSYELTGGVLGHRDRLNTSNLMEAIDPSQFAAIFAEEHESWFAEPEFAGQYVDALAQHYRRTSRPLYLDRARVVVDSIVTNQRADGYLGTYRKGLEFDETFSVWNQGFVIKGLVSYYDVTGEERALDAAIRCADFIAAHYAQPGAPDILKSVNQCVQHTTILQQIVRLYRVTGKQLYLDFADYIVARWEATTIKFITASNDWSVPILEIGSLKAIETLVCFQGIVELHDATGVERYLTAAVRYWEAVRKSQINVIGCGAIAELWVIGGNHPANLPIDVRPNETCVAWGWARLSMMLFERTGDARYIDAIEQTLYNHIFGAQAADGTDFSYYQGHIGRKVHAKRPGQYSCCRYRGLHYLSYVGDYAITYAEPGAGDEPGTVFVNLYTPVHASVLDDAITVNVQTDYPRSGAIQIVMTLRETRGLQLRLRIPAWSASHQVSVDGGPCESRTEDGYTVIARTWSAGNHEIALSLDMSVRVERANVDHRDSVAVMYGPLTLAIDSRFGTPIHATEIDVGQTNPPALQPLELDAADYLPIVAFSAAGAINGKASRVTLVDYASAGSQTPNHDEFKVWLPIATRSGEGGDAT